MVAPLKHVMKQYNIRGDMELESLKGKREGSKLKWWHKVNTLVNERYHKLLLDMQCVGSETV